MYRSRPRLSTLSFSLFLSRSLARLHLPRSFENCARTTSLKLQLDCGFLGNSPDFYARSPASVASRDSFSRYRCVLPPRFAPSAIPSNAVESLISLSFSSSLLFFIVSSLSLSQTALGFNALRFRCLRTSCRAMRINRAPICRYAQSTRTPLQRGGNAWYFANRLNALLNDADTRQTPCLTNAIIVTQYYYISGANVLRC